MLECATDVGTGKAYDPSSLTPGSLGIYDRHSAHMCGLDCESFFIFFAKGCYKVHQICGRRASNCNPGFFNSYAFFFAFVALLREQSCRMGGKKVARGQSPLGEPLVSAKDQLTKIEQPLSRTRKNCIFVAALFAQLLASIDTSIMPTALPTIVAHFDEFSSYSWILTSYTLATTITSVFVQTRAPHFFSH